MNLQENTLFDFDLEVKVTPHIAQYPLHLLTYARVKFLRLKVLKEMHLQGNLVKQNLAHCPLHFVFYAATKFEVAMSNGLEGKTFTRKYIIQPLSLPFWSRSKKRCPVPCTSCDLCSLKV